MKLIKVESMNTDAPIWYFTNTTAIAEYFNTSLSSLVHQLAKKNTFKHHYLEEILNADDVLSYYINPNEKGIRYTDYKKVVK